MWGKHLIEEIRKQKKNHPNGSKSKEVIKNKNR